MTPEHAKALLPFITAYSEGKTIQHNSNAGIETTPEWTDMINPRFLCDPNDLRIKPATHPDVSFSPDGYLLPPRVGEWASRHPLTEASIPEGHRPYVVGEKLRRGDRIKGTAEIVGYWAGRLAEKVAYTLFTTAPLPEPKLVPMNSDDLPPVFWIRNTGSSPSCYLVTAISDNGWLYYGRYITVKPSSFPGWEYSADRKTWHSLMKEVQA